MEKSVYKQKKDGLKEKVKVGLRGVPNGQGSKLGYLKNTFVSKRFRLVISEKVFLV